VRRNPVSAFLLYWAVLTLSPLLVGLSLVVSSYLTSIPLIYGTAQSIGLSEGLLLNYTPFFLVSIAFSILYIVVPNCNVAIRHGILGGVVAGILFEIAKWGFTLYITLFPTYQLLYGALAAIPIFLLWVYLSWMIILFGAEVAQAGRAQYDRRGGEKLDGFTQAVRWLGHLWQAQQQGKGLAVHELVRLDPYNYEIEPDEQIQHLLKAKLIQPTEKGAYILSRDLNQFCLWDLYRALPWQLPTPERIQVMQGPWEEKLEGLISKIDQIRHTELNLPLAKLFEDRERARS